MAYSFNGSSDYVAFDIAPFNGSSFGVGTIACFVKRSSSTFDSLVAITDSSFNELMMLYTDNSNVAIAYRGSSPVSSGITVGNTSVWYLIAITFGATGAATPRFHIHDGSAWTHTTGGAFGGSDLTVSGTNKLVVGRASAGLYLAGSVVCAGIKKANASDGDVETLSRTSFQAWRDFGFDWLIGFDSSLESAGVLQDQGSPGTGDEAAISGTSQVSDPAGWSWAAPAATFVPQIVIL
jgi:hypothetical protein